MSIESDVMQILTAPAFQDDEKTVISIITSITDNISEIGKIFGVIYNLNIGSFDLTDSIFDGYFSTLSEISTFIGILENNITSYMFALAQMNRMLTIINVEKGDKKINLFELWKNPIFCIHHFRTDGFEEMIDLCITMIDSLLKLVTDIIIFNDNIPENKSGETVNIENFGLLIVRAANKLICSLALPTSSLSFNPSVASTVSASLKNEVNNIKAHLSKLRLSDTKISCLLDVNMLIESTFKEFQILQSRHLGDDGKKLSREKIMERISSSEKFAQSIKLTCTISREKMDQLFKSSQDVIGDKRINLRSKVQKESKCY